MKSNKHDFGLTYVCKDTLISHLILPLQLVMIIENLMTEDFIVATLVHFKLQQVSFMERDPGSTELAL